VSDAWQLISERPGGSVACFAVHDDEVLAVSTAAVHRSVDAGATWSTLSAGQPAPPLYVLTPSRRSLFVGGASGLFRSRDHATSWRQVLTAAAVTSLAVAADETLLAGTDTEGVLRSDDDGETWASGNPGLLDLNVLCLADGFAGTATGLYRSVNAGRSWREVQLPANTVAVECLARSGGTVLAGTDSAGAFVSTDVGRTWSSVAGVGSAVSAVAVDGARMAIGGPGGVWLSRDGGQTWRHATTPDVVLSLVFVGGDLLAGLAREGVLRVGLGSSWGLHGRIIVDLACTPGGALLTAGIEEGVQRSTDGGRTWATVDGCGASATRLAVGCERVYAATSEGLYSSTDDGCHWTAQRSDVPCIAVAATSTGLAMAAFEDGQFFVCIDGVWRAQAWERGRVLSVGVADDGTLYVAEQQVVWRSNDACRSWSVWLRCANPSIAVHGADVVVSSDTRVYRLLGGTWLPAPVTGITFDTLDRVYASTTRGVHRSTDGARNFMRWSDNLPDLPVLAVRATPREVLALLFGGSLWRRDC
jgi:hypothetical protein